jgi:hypothetical protein
MMEKTNYFHMRMSNKQKMQLKEQAEDVAMTMTQYVWYLIIKDKEDVPRDL